MAFGPKFKDIRIAHFDGFTPGTILIEVQEFLDNPVHEDYQLIKTHVDYFHPGDTCPVPQGSDPENCMWVEVTIVYVE